jgi:hypothetical protein
MINLKHTVISFAMLALSFIAVSQDTSLKLPPMSMLEGGPSIKQILELNHPAHYSIHNVNGQFVDSGFAEFVDYTDYEPGIYFLRYDTINQQFEKKEDPILIENIQNENQQLHWIVKALGGLSLIILVALVLRNGKNRNERTKLLAEIERLKKIGISPNTSELASTKEISLDREKIEESISAKLNESDWKIIDHIIKYPSISNNELSELVSLSVEGCRSSLKKMYRLFEIPTSRSMKLNLAIKLIRLTKNQQ